ncbi:MAG: hypothetical protein ACI4LO_08085 [Anaerovoracaceae bacterium]
MMETISINNRRLELIRKGYVNRKELAEFLNVGKTRATAVYEEIASDIAKEDKTIDILGIRTCRILEYMGLTEEDIRRFARDERRQEANVS